MTVVGLDHQAFKQLISELKLKQLCLAGINSPQGITASGSSEQLTTLENELESRNIFFKRLNLDYAFHSPAMDSIKSGLNNQLADLKSLKSNLPFYSTVTGQELAGNDLDAN